MRGRVLIIAGSDPSGGAGLQADIKTVTALGGYAMTAVTALTVQDTQGVRDVQTIAPAFIRAQIDACLDDIGADAIKVGMLGDVAGAKAIAAALKEKAAGIPVVLDPVLAATSGDALAGEGVAGVILKELVPLAQVITPNTDELSVLARAGVISSRDQMIEAGKRLAAQATGAALLLKGGHLAGAEVIDILLAENAMRDFRRPRIDTTSTHGTGCTLASAVAAGLAQGLSLGVSVERAVRYIDVAIRTAPGFGAGHGPLNHGCTIEKRWRSSEEI